MDPSHAVQATILEATSSLAFQVSLNFIRAMVTSACHGIVLGLCGILCKSVDASVRGRSDGGCQEATAWLVNIALVVLNQGSSVGVSHFVCSNSCSTLTPYCTVCKFRAPTSSGAFLH